MHWTKYEEITKDIYEKLGAVDGVKVLCYGKDCKLTGESGVEHQVDVLTSHKTESKKYRTAIECKYYSTSVSKDPIMKLHCIMNDCHIDYGVIVAKNGFTDDAIKYANHIKSISLVELRKPLDKDWSGRARDMTAIIRLHHSNIDKIEIYSEDFDETKRYMPQDLTVQYPDGKTIGLVDLLISQDTPELDRYYTFDTLPKGTVISSGSDTCFSGKISIKYHIEEKSIEVSRTEYKGDDLVSFYMRQIFEDTRFHIDKYGSIKEIN